MNRTEADKTGWHRIPLLLLSSVTLGIIPGNRSTLFTYEFKIFHEGNPVGKYTYQEEVNGWFGWVFLPYVGTIGDGTKAHQNIYNRLVQDLQTDGVFSN